MANRIAVSALGTFPPTAAKGLNEESAIRRMMDHWQTELDRVLPDKPDLIALPEKVCDRYEGTIGRRRSPTTATGGTACGISSPTSRRTTTATSPTQPFGRFPTDLGAPRPQREATRLPEGEGQPQADRIDSDLPRIGSYLLRDGGGLRA